MGLTLMVLLGASITPPSYLQFSSSQDERPGDVKKGIKEAESDEERTRDGRFCGDRVILKTRTGKSESVKKIEAPPQDQV
ncbi:hypothetical protein K1719_026670 [Acacia pycnantha]|nr:hypothetical protein K1719_026670 [Acacia pycnantha]